MTDREHDRAATRLMIGTAVVVVVFGFLLDRARGHEPYTDWRMPSNPAVSCCNNADCRPTRAYVDEDGIWHAWTGTKWLWVPPEKVLPTDYAGDGRSHLCEQAGWVYCFTPGPPRS